MGRGLLASVPALAEETLLREGGEVSHLLTLLWHKEGAIQRAAALALPGGDLANAYTPAYGYFASQFLRGLMQAAPPPTNFRERYEAVMQSLRGLLAQTICDIRAMSNMNYSFLSSALYLALLTTCHDALEAIRRLRVAGAHPELCRLLGDLARPDISRRLNSMDNERLAQAARNAFSALPPDHLGEFWHALAHPTRASHNQLVALLFCIVDRRATPHLVGLLAHPSPMTDCIIFCLARLGDARALPALRELGQGRNRSLRQPAIAAIAAIERANAAAPSRTLLRAVAQLPAEEATTLLRPLSNGAVLSEPPEEMLRVPETS